MGATFKEDCPDLRNTRVVDLIHALQRYGMELLVVDPWADPEEAQREYGLKVLAAIPSGKCWSAVVVAVAHQQFRALPPEQWQPLLTPDGVLVDLKGLVPRQLHPLRI